MYGIIVMSVVKLKSEKKVVGYVKCIGIEHLAT